MVPAASSLGPSIGCVIDRQFASGVEMGAIGGACAA
jgi:hypothetical protein